MGFGGSNGGGATIIECYQSIIINKGASITANGENVDCNEWSGCGSGGSIWIRAPIIKNNGIISAVGGKNIFKDAKSGKKPLGGSGGNGRIRIDCDKAKSKLGNIKPNYFIKDIGDDLYW